MKAYQAIAKLATASENLDDHMKDFYQQQVDKFFNSLSSEIEIDKKSVVDRLILKIKHDGRLYYVKVTPSLLNDINVSVLSSQADKFKIRDLYLAELRSDI